MDASNKVIDCFGNEYERINMFPTGFCGFHALSYCLTGNQLSYANVIHDCLNVFANIPELFRLRTNFGGGKDSSLTLSDYAAFMQNAIDRVQSGFPLHTDAWCEDAHLGAVSLLYNITILTYSVQNKEWHVFNESGTRGYILLLNSPGHFDVLNGSNSNTPVVPCAARTHGVNRHSLNTSDEAWLSLQSPYNFELVHAFPQQFAGIHILGYPVVPFHRKPTETVRKETYAAVVSRPRPIQCTVQGLQLHRRNVREVNKPVKDHCLDRIDQLADKRPVAAIPNRHHAVHVETTQGHAAVPRSKKPRRMCDVNESSPVPRRTTGLLVPKAKHEVQKSLQHHSDDCIDQIAENRTSSKTSHPLTVYTEDFAQSAGVNTCRLRRVFCV